MALGSPRPRSPVHRDGCVVSTAVAAEASVRGPLPQLTTTEGLDPLRNFTRPHAGSIARGLALSSRLYESAAPDETATAARLGPGCISA